MKHVEVPDELEDLLEFAVRNEWGDGLPLIPPTPARVERMLASVGLGGDEPIGRLPPAQAIARAGAIAANAVMAGCGSEHFPVVIGAVQAVSDPSFNLHGIQTTTNPVGVAVIVSGPIRRSANVNAGIGCLGPGWRGNATIGRALRLILMNIGGGSPRGMDAATHGFPGKYGMCFAENEEESPWEPMHVVRGFQEQESVVTTLGVSGTISVIESTSSPRSLASVLGQSIYYPGSNDYLYRGEPVVLLGPEHASLFARAGMSRSDTQQAIFEASFVSRDRFSSSNIEYCLDRTRSRDFVTRDGAIMVPAASDPSGIHLLVGGGPSIHSTIFPTYGVTRMVSVPVDAFFHRTPSF